MIIIKKIFLIDYLITKKFIKKISNKKKKIMKKIIHLNLTFQNILYN